MVSKTMVVKAAEGLHMRPAGVIAREAGKFDSDVTIVFGDKRINAKSLVNIIAACIKKDAEINQSVKSIGGVICTKESPAQKESESEMWSLSKNMR